MMRDRFGKALFTGLILGLISGTLEVLYKLYTRLFEWFEIYQVYLVAFLAFALIFLIIAISLEVLFKFVKVPISIKKITSLHFTIAIFILPFIYLMIYLNLHVIRSALLAPTSIAANLLLSSVFTLLFLITLLKGQHIIMTILAVFNKYKIKSLASNLIFFIVIFMVSSLLLDVFTINHWDKTPSALDDISNRPNILLISLDAVRADHMSLYNYSKTTTPNIDTLARQAVVFDEAMASSSWSFPSDASMFTGKYPQNHNAVVTHQKLDASQLTLAEILKDNGYNTGAMVSSGFTTGKFGLDQGFSTYHDRLDPIMGPSYPVSILHLLPMLLRDPSYLDGTRTIKEINKDFFTWLDQNGDKPFFFFLHYFEAHEPYKPDAKSLSLFTNDTKRSYGDVQNALAKFRYEPVDGSIVEYMKALYDAEIYSMDENLKDLFDKLESKNLLNNTIVIITADHGQEFFEHGGTTHGQTLYQEVIHVPLIIRYPERLPPQRISTPVENMDIFSTVLDLVKIDVPSDVDSTSLIPLIDARQYSKSFLLTQLFGREYLGEKTQRSVRHGNWKLIEVSPEDSAVPSSLFDLSSDPLEKENLYGKELDIQHKLEIALTNISKPTT